MKKNLLILLSVTISCLYFTPAHSQVDTAALLKSKDSVIKSLQDSFSRLKNAAPAKDTAAAPAACTSCCAKASLGGWQWLLVFLPALFVIFLGYYLIKWIKKDGFKLADALSGASVTRMETRTTKDAQGNAIQEDVPVTEPVPSASRLIAFITGVAAVIIAICLVTYYAYFAIANCTTPVNYEQLWKILAGLGIGVIPYGINVWNKNTKENPPQPGS